ncbi:MAG TPA: OstA-like protein [Puia sp.]|nr:OstA-like protein [Puia sp.]
MKRIVFLIFLLASFFMSIAQQPAQPAPAEKDSLVPLHILRADRIREETKDSAKYQSLIGNVQLQKGTTLFYCDSVVMNNKDKVIEAFGKVHMNDSDTTNIFSDYMKYFEDKKYIIFQKRVKMTDGKATLYTDDLGYDMNLKIGTYNNGGKLINKSSTLTSKEGVYYAETKDVYFKKDVYLKDPAYDLKTDSLLYNTDAQLATFITETLIKDSSGSTIVTREGNYDLRNHKALFGKRPTIKQGSQRITGDHVNFDDSTGMSVATGNVVFVDTAENISVIGNYMIANRKTKNFLATENPLMILKQEDDSIYITADTLFSGKLTDLMYADSIKKHNDSIVAEKLRIKDSIYNDSVKIAQKKMNDSLNIINEIMAKENQRKKDSAELAHIDISDSVFLKGVIAQQNSLTPAPEIKKGKIKKNLAKPPLQKDVKKNEIENKQVLAKQSANISPPEQVDTTIAKKQPSITDSSTNNILARIGANDSFKSVTKTDSSGIQKDTVAKNYAVSIHPENDSSNRYLQAYHHVRIFSDSLQAVSDSLFYSAKDSVFQLFSNPVVWANGSQVTGDTIYLYTKNKKASRLYVFENGLAVNKVGDNLFNQIKGTTLNGYFKDGVIDYMRAKGNAESIYYAQDDNKAFFGVNQAKADIIDMVFVNKELNKVILRSDADGTMYPIKKVNFDDMRLRNFKWLEDKRPKSKYELFENNNPRKEETPQQNSPAEELKN